MTDRRHMDAAAIAGELAGCVDSLCLELLPNGHLEGGEWRVGSIAGEAGKSMSVRLTGPRAGVWCDFGGPDSHRGDALDLVAQVLFRGDKRQALAWSRAWLGIDQVDPKSFAQRRVEAVAKKERQEKLDTDMRGAAQKIYLGASVGLRFTPVDAYLQGRGIDLSVLGRQPRALRYEPQLWNAQSSMYWPAMVASITAPDGAFAGVHRTWLAAAPGGGYVKAPVADPKLTLGRYAGGCIRLWRGKSGRPLREAPDDEWPLIAEGIEDGLTAVCADPSRRVLVAVSLSNMGSLELPEQIPGVVLLGQNDEKPQAIAALERAVEHFQRSGKRVRIARPPAGVKDVNELAQGALTGG